jgi:ABC-type phosphate transport system permease subunit
MSIPTIVTEYPHKRNEKVTIRAYFCNKKKNERTTKTTDCLYVLATGGTDIETARPLAYGTALVLIVLVLISNIAVSILRKARKNKQI